MGQGGLVVKMMCVVEHEQGRCLGWDERIRELSDEIVGSLGILGQVDERTIGHVWAETADPFSEVAPEPEWVLISVVYREPGCQSVVADRIEQSGSGG